VSNLCSHARYTLIEPLHALVAGSNVKPEPRRKSKVAIGRPAAAMATTPMQLFFWVWVGFSPAEIRGQLLLIGEPAFSLR
jgi:hypothetical protein